VAPKRSDVVKLRAAPRSLYALRGPARWAWQHSVAPVDELRWSITLRTARASRPGVRSCNATVSGLAVQRCTARPDTVALQDLTPQGGVRSCRRRRGR